MAKKASYILTAYSFLSTHSLDELLDVGYENKNGKPIPSFDELLLIDLCKEAQETFEKENNILKIDGDLIIVGDIHGSFHDLLRILNFIFESKSKALFLGDYVDRGQFSLECVTLLFALKVMYPDTIYLLRGNHEFDSVCSLYGFKNEILNCDSSEIFDDALYGISDTFSPNPNCYKYTENLYNAFIQVFSYLPIGAIVNNTTFCIHGGLSPKIDLIDDINEKIKRPINTFGESQLLSDLLWSDPTSCTNSSFYENPRGYGCLFNRESVYNFIKNNSIKRIIRAHQCVSNGCKSHFEDKCITIFSVSSYSKSLGNCSSILQLFQDTDSINVTSFTPLCHLLKNEAFFYKVQPLNDSDVNNRACFSLLHPKLYLNSTVPRITKNSNSSQIRPRRKVALSGGKSSNVQLIKPKFTTNGRCSYPYQKNSPVSIKLNSSNYSCDE